MTTAMVGCAPLVVGGVAVATGATVSTINDRRSAGAIVNDGVIEKRLRYEITQALKEQLGDEPERPHHVYETDCRGQRRRYI